MVFNSDVFLFAFLPIVFGLFWTCRGRQARYVLLSLAGYVFYGWWDWRYCFLLLFSSLVSYTAGVFLLRATSHAKRKLIVVATVSVDLTVLGVFKYYDFLARSLMSLTGPESLPLLDVALPIGISFYTFHTISYVVDVAQGKVRATTNLWEYLTYVNLFSQLVAGPIVRFRQIEEDLEKIDGPPRNDWMAMGIGFFVVGLIKKVVIADHIASGIDPILAHPAGMNFTESWITAAGYTCQLYFDFSGYSDMAVGLGYMFGLRIPQNFNAPYRAAGITDFWRRWHISLSTWLRDYLYIPLGGNRLGVARMYVNLMIVMLLGGLWHGANWTFVVWGAYHGLLLIVDRVGAPVLRRLPRLAYQVQTLFLVVLGWVLFRSTDFGMAMGWLERMVTPDTLAIGPHGTTVGWITIALVSIAFVPETWDFKFKDHPAWAFVWAACLLGVYLFMNGAESVFLYYQF